MGGVAQETSVHSTNGGSPPRQCAALLGKKDKATGEIGRQTGTGTQPEPRGFTVTREKERERESERGERERELLRT